MFLRLQRRLRALFRRSTVERELDDELRFHLEQEIAFHRARGLSEAEARRQARLSFGGVEQTKEAAREVRGVRWLEQFVQDLRHAWRRLAKAPAFTAVAVLSLALGIGANTALFSVADALLLRALPVTEPGRLVLFEWEAGERFRNSGTDGWSYLGREGRRGSSSFHTRIFRALQAASASADSPLATLFAFAELRKANLFIDGQAEVADGQYASGSYFAGLGVAAQVGRLLGEEDDRPGAPLAAVVTHGYWQTRLGGDPNALGKKLTINAVPFTIVGVAPAAFTGTMQVDSRPVVFVPLAAEPLLTGERSHLQPQGERRGGWWLNLMGRLRPGATAQQAQQSFAGVFRALALEMIPPPRPGQPSVTLSPAEFPNLIARPGRAGMMESRKGYAETIYRLFGVVGLVLLICCANLGNLQLARAAGRRGEVSVRIALGAGRGRLVRQFLTESLLLSALGGLAGLGLALLGQGVLTATGSGLFPDANDYQLRGRVFGFSLAVSLLTVVLAGLPPALRSTRQDVGIALRQSGRATAGLDRSRLSKTLVVAEVAMSLILLVGATLFLRTLRNLHNVPVGFNQDNLLLFHLRPESLGYRGARLESLYDQLFARLDALPGVEAATFGRVRLLSHNGTTDRLIVPGESPSSSTQHSANIQVARENYLTTMQIPLLAGRSFASHDRQGSQPVALINETLARRHFPRGNALGQRIGIDSDFARSLEIVGIVADSKYNRQRRAVAPLVLLPWRQSLRGVGEMFFSVRTSGPPEALLPAIRQEIAAVAPGLPLAAVTTQRAQSRQTMAGEALMARLLGFFGVVALLLCAIGLFALVAWSVAQRTAEIGIRMALGAPIAEIRRMVVARGLRLVATGLAIGTAAALALARLIESQLYGVTTTDPTTFLLATTVLLVVALAACWLPALRATRVSPMVALRVE